MKKNRIVLFTILFFSTVTPLEMQANLGWTALRNKTSNIGRSMKKWVNSNAKITSDYLKKHNKKVKAIVIIGCLLGCSCYPILSEYTPKESLSRVINEKLRPYGLLGKFCHPAPLKPVFVEEIRSALKDLDIPDYVIKKISISGMRPRDCFSQKNIPKGETFIFSPFFMRFNTKYLETASAFNRKFLFLHEAGHIKLHRGSYRNVFKIMLNEELSEVGADICALATLVRQTTKDNLPDLLENLTKYKENCYSYYNPQKLVYLTPQELVYYGKELFAMMQQGKDKLDVLAYAQNLINARR